MSLWTRLSRGGYQLITKQCTVIALSPVGDPSVVISLYVCLSVRKHISRTTHPNVTKFLVQVACGSDLDLFW